MVNSRLFKEDNNRRVKESELVEATSNEMKVGCVVGKARRLYEKDERECG